MSTLKADAVTAKTSDTDVTITGSGTGVPNIEAGFKVGGSAGVPTASIQDNAVTLAKIASGTDGELITWDASGDPAAVAVGTATHVLTSNGTGAAPTFQAAAAGGALTYISTVTASDGDSSIDFTSGIDSTYDYYQFHLYGIRPNTDDRTIHMRYRIGGSFETGSYYQANTAQQWGFSAALASSNYEDVDNLLIASQVGDGANEEANGVVTLWNPASTTVCKLTQWNITGNGQNTIPRGSWGIGTFNNVTTAVTGLTFYFASSATINAGTIRLYGVSKT